MTERIPGLVNAHSHAFQRVIRGRTERRTKGSQDSFWTWREAMYHAASKLSPEDIYHVSRMAFLEMVLSGITTVGEFHYLHNAAGGDRYDDPNLLAFQVIRAADEVGLRIVLLRAAYARPGFNLPPNPLQSRFLTRSVEHFFADTEELMASGLATVGLAPHSVRALPIEYLRAVFSFAQGHRLPIHMHVSEQPAEVEACLSEHGQRPIELLEHNGLLDSRFTAIHAIHLNQDEITFLGKAGPKVCACPTTERNLGDGAVPADQLQAAGVKICFGSDSNAPIDLLEDARSLEYHLRMNRLQRAILEPEPLFAGATSIGAAALGIPESETLDDFFTIDLDDPSLVGLDRDHVREHVVFFAERTAVRDVYVKGRRVVENGHHPLQEEIVRKFAEVQGRLWE